MSTQRNEDCIEKAIIVEQYNLDRDIIEAKKKEEPIPAKQEQSLYMSSILELSQQEKSQQEKTENDVNIPTLQKGQRVADSQIIGTEAIENESGSFRETEIQPRVTFNPDLFYEKSFDLDQKVEADTKSQASGSGTINQDTIVFRDAELTEKLESQPWHHQTQPKKVEQDRWANRPANIQTKIKSERKLVEEEQNVQIQKFIGSKMQPKTPLGKTMPLDSMSTANFKTPVFDKRLDMPFKNIPEEPEIDQKQEQDANEYEPSENAWSYGRRINPIRKVPAKSKESNTIFKTQHATEIAKRYSLVGKVPARTKEQKEEDWSQGIKRTTPLGKFAVLSKDQLRSKTVKRPKEPSLGRKKTNATLL